MNCGECFKQVRDPEACIACAAGMSGNIITKAMSEAGLDLGTMTQEEFEEVRFDIFSKIRSVKKKEEQAMSGSLLAVLLSKCSDTAIYLAKKRTECLDDFRCVLFDIMHREAYITNADVIIRLSDLPDDAVMGLCDLTPAYDYMSESFIPNPLPWTTEKLSEDFGGMFQSSFKLPVTHAINSIFAAHPEPIDRRSHFAVFDTGLNHTPGSIIVPGFSRTVEGLPIFKPTPDSKPILVHNKSQIHRDFVADGVSYIGLPEVRDDAIYLDLYKTFGDKVVVGMYKLIPNSSPDDLNPFFLEGYSERNVFAFKIASDDVQDSILEKYQSFKNFKPFVIELEYLYESLILLASFGYDLVNIYSNGTNEKIIMEGVKVSQDQPTIEICIAPVVIGDPGMVCETILERQLVI